MTESNMENLRGLYNKDTEKNEFSYKEKFNNLKEKIVKLVGEKKEKPNEGKEEDLVNKINEGHKLLENFYKKCQNMDLGTEDEDIGKMSFEYFFNNLQDIANQINNEELKVEFDSAIELRTEIKSNISNEEVEISQIKNSELYSDKETQESSYKNEFESKSKEIVDSIGEQKEQGGKEEDLVKKINEGNELLKDFHEKCQGWDWESENDNIEDFKNFLNNLSYFKEQVNDEQLAEEFVSAIRLKSEIEDAMRNIKEQEN